MNFTKTKADLVLLSVTVFWGTTFIVSKLVLSEINLSVYLSIRLTIAALFMNLIALRFRQHINKTAVVHGTILGVLLFFSYFFQMWGIQHTSASNAGFITGLNVAFVPVFLVILFREKPRPASLLGVVLATIGLFLLTGGKIDGLNKGDLLVLVCAFVVAFHVIFTGRFAPKSNIYALTAIQLSTTAILSIIYAQFFEFEADMLNANIIITLIYLALFGTVYTFLMQTSMQRFTTATRTALVFSMEPVFAALFAYPFASESLSLTGWFGGGLIVTGMIIAEIEWTVLFGKARRK